MVRYICTQWSSESFAHHKQIDVLIRHVFRASECYDTNLRENES